MKDPALAIPHMRKVAVRHSMTEAEWKGYTAEEAAKVEGIIKAKLEGELETFVAQHSYGRTGLMHHDRQTVQLGVGPDAFNVVEWRLWTVAEPR